MTTTLTRPTVPTKIIPPEQPRRSGGRFVAWVVGVALIAATVVLAFQVFGGAPSDGSWDTAEASHMATLSTPADVSFQSNETARMASLAPEDSSWFEAEAARMGSLLPEDTSWTDAEAARFDALAPVSDGSFEANEAARMADFAAVDDGSFDANETARFHQLDPNG